MDISRKFSKCSISKMSWSFSIILHQVAVLMSTSDPPNMKLKLLLIMEIQKFSIFT